VELVKCCNSSPGLFFNFELRQIHEVEPLCSSCEFGSADPVLVYFDDLSDMGSEN